MVPAARADALVRATLALADASLRVAYLRGLLRDSQPEQLAPGLELLCARAEQAEPRARECLVSLVDALAWNEPELVMAVQRLREEAAGESFWALERLLRSPLDASSLATADLPKKENVPDYGKGRPLTLGERKSLARKPDRDMLERLLLDPHPDVIHWLLVNPRLTEDDVIRIATKRPCRADVLSEIARSEKWMHRSRVRLAIVLNPSTPLALAAPIVSLLMRQELKLVAESTALSPVIRALCIEHLERRPPVEFDDDLRLQ